MSNRNRRRQPLLVESLEERMLLNSTPVLSLTQTAFDVVKTSTLSVSISATDKDNGQNLTFSLIGAPAGATISTTQQYSWKGSAAVGTLLWTPSEDQGPASYTFTVKVTDNGYPARSATKTITACTLAAGLVGNDLWIIGTSTNKGTLANPGNDSVSVSSTSFSNKATVVVNGSTGTFSIPTGGRIVAKLFGGNDQFSLNEGTGTSVLKRALSVDGGTGANTLTVNGTQGADAFTITDTTVALAGAGTLTYENVQSLFVNGLGGNDTFAMTAIRSETITTLNGGAALDSFAGTFATEFDGSLILSNMETSTLSVTGAVLAGSTITGTDFTNVAIGVLGGTLWANGGSITNANIGTIATTGLLKATETSTLSAGVLSQSTVGIVEGAIHVGSIVNCEFGVVAPGATITAQGQGTATDVTIGTLNGTFEVVEDSNADSGIMTNTTIEQIGSTGEVLAGAISGMTVGTTDEGSSIVAAGHGTANDVTIGTLNGTFEVVEDSNADSGIMTNTTIELIGSTGEVLAGAISGMTVGTADEGSSIVAAGHGTASDVTIGKLNGTFEVVEDSNADSGIMTNTTIEQIGSTGEVLAGAISGITVGTADEGSSIVAAGHGTASDVTIGTLNGTFAIVEDSNPGSGIATNIVVDEIGSTGEVLAGAISGMTVGTTDEGSSIIAAGLGTIDNLTITIHAGTVSAEKDDMPGSGSLTNATIGTLTVTGVVTANSASGLNIATYIGTVNVTTGLSNFAVGTLTGTANLIAGHFLNVTAQHAGPIVNFVEPTVTRTIAVTPHILGGGVPDFSLYYDGTGSSNPSIVVNINAGVENLYAVTANNFDLAVTTSTATSGGAGFDLAGVYSTANSQTGIHNLVVGGNLLLGAVPAGAVDFLGLPATTAGGVQLPQDSVAVAVAGNLPAASILAKSVPSIAADSFAGIGADNATNIHAKIPLAAGTGLTKANDTFLLFFSEAGNVAQFVVTSNGNSFDSKKLLFADIVTDNAPVTAQVTVIPTGNTSGVYSVAFTGQGGSLTTAQPIISLISAIGGSIGNLILSSPYGLSNVTADSIIGNIDVPNGSIHGVVKTTVGDMGRALTDSNGNIIGVTTIHAESISSHGKILSAGNLISFIELECGMDGVIATNGDIGVIQTIGGVAKLKPDGSLIRFGGIEIEDGGVSGEIIALGNAFGDISINGWLSGRITVKGNPEEFGLAPFRYGILGNLTICGGLWTTGAIVSSGLIGDDNANNIPHDRHGTQLSISGPILGIVAAGQDINFDGSDFDFINYFVACLQGRIFENATGSNQAAIDSIFTNNDSLLDVLDPVELDLIIQDLLLLRISGGKLTGTTP